MKIWILTLAAVIGTAQVSAQTVVKTKRGYAEDADSGALLYIEEHEQTVTDGNTVAQTIRYRDPAGEVFAEKMLDFRRNIRQPLFTLTDRLRNYREGLRQTDQGLEVFCFEDGEERSKKLNDLGFVADAGFDRIIESDWDQLVDGKTIKFDFLVPAREGTVKFRLKKTDQLEYLGQNAVEFTMAPANSLIRWLVPPIVVVYDVNERALLKYRGISNLRDEELQNYDVMIRFPPEERQVITDQVAQTASEGAALN